MCMLLNTCNFIKRIEQVLVELDNSAIEDYAIIIVVKAVFSIVRICILIINL